MRALTLWQPWASLVAAGIKRTETRRWKTPYRGPLAIHAAKFMPRKLDELWVREAERRLDCSLDELPRGAVVALARLVEIVPSEDARAAPDPWGDYAAGRWVWRLACIEPTEPILVRGYQRLWNWDPPPEYGENTP